MDSISHSAPLVRKVQKQEKYSRTIAVHEAKHAFYEGMMSCFGSFLGFIGAIPCCFFIPNPYKVVEQGTVGMLCKYGKCARMVDPGMHYVNPTTERLIHVNVKLVIADIPRQCVLTRDNVNINIDSVMTYCISDPYVATFLVEDLHTTLIERTMTTLRQTIGMRMLQECIENKESLANEISSIITPVAKKWGANVKSLQLKDLELPSEIMENLSAAARQRRQGESKVIAAQAEVEAAMLLRKASDILNTPAAMQIRYLDTLNAMAANSNSNVIFMPLNSEKTVKSSQFEPTS